MAFLSIIASKFCVLLWVMEFLLSVFLSVFSIKSLPQVCVVNMIILQLKNMKLQEGNLTKMVLLKNMNPKVPIQVSDSEA